jgi:hypothetical protein
MARRVTNKEEWHRLSDADREERTNALSAVRLARREGIPLADAADEVDSSMEAIYRWAPEAVQRGALGIAFATTRDQIWRLRPLYVEGGLDFVEVEGSDQADEAERIFDLQWAWIHGDRVAGDELQRYRGTRIDGRRVETDLDALRPIAERGNDPLEIYRELLG